MLEDWSGGSRTLDEVLQRTFGPNAADVVADSEVLWELGG